MFTVNRNPTPSDIRGFGWAMVLGFGGIAVLLWLVPPIRAWDVAALAWSGRSGQIVALCLAGLGTGLCLLSAFAPGAARPVYITWMSVTVPIGVFMSCVMLTVLFVFLLPVFSLVVRLGDPLRKKLNPSGTYWEDYKPHAPTLERMRRPF